MIKTRNSEAVRLGQSNYWNDEFSIYPWKQQQSSPLSNNHHIIHSIHNVAEAHKKDQAQYLLVPVNYIFIKIKQSSNHFYPMGKKKENNGN